MRRWFEIGCDNFFIDPVVISSESDRWGGSGQAAFLSMPHKGLFVSILQGAAVGAFKHQWLLIKPGTADAPAGDCTAQHVPLGFVLGNPAPFVQGSLYGQLLGGFPIMTTEGDWSGAFGAGIFSTISREPPDKNGS